MRIFITGFQRSGTTLLRHIIQNHLDVKRILHESAILSKHNNGFTILRKAGINIKRDNWGEKIPWFSPSKIKRHKGGIISYCKKWNTFFLPTAKIIQIVRNPIDVLLSNKKTFRLQYASTFRLMSYIPKIVSQIESFENSMTIKFENLVSNQEETIKDIFEFLELDISSEIVNRVINYKYRKFNKIDSNRAFANNNIFKDQFDFSIINNELNKYKGFKYED